MTNNDTTARMETEAWDAIFDHFGVEHGKRAEVRQAMSAAGFAMRVEVEIAHGFKVWTRASLVFDPRRVGPAKMVANDDGESEQVCDGCRDGAVG